MDTSDKEIQFDSKGVCNHCHDYQAFVSNWNLTKRIKNNEFESLMEEVKTKGKNKEYDCILGLSGGVDSSYVAYLAWKNGLRPLCVHLDNGWNSELATQNIYQIVETCGFDLHTHVIDWEEFKELQRAFFKADVIDLELLSDHAIFGVIIELAKKYGIKSILSGANFSTEHIMPKSWVHRKQDLANIKDLNRKFGTQKIKSFPQVSTLKHVFLMFGMGYKVYKPLNLIDFNKKSAKELLIREFGWRDYGGKHYESIFTKFYQGHILPEKFKVDKRRAHLSTLINSKQITRDEALEELKTPPIPRSELKQDCEFVLKKLGFDQDWFSKYLERPEIPHLSYKSDQFTYNLLFKVKEILGKSL